MIVTETADGGDLLGKERVESKMKPRFWAEGVGRIGWAGDRKSRVNYLRCLPW